MIFKKVSISLILAVALSLSGCGGGGGTPAVDPAGNLDPVVVDTTIPVFVNDANITLNQTIEEGSTSLTIATIEAEDPSGITFSLSGENAEYFELVDTKVRAIYSTVLKFKDVPDYEVLSTYKVNVNATDSKGNVATKEFTIDLEDKPFVFDVTSNMGSILEGNIGTLALVTKEAKNNDVEYTIAGSSPFTLSNGIVIFNAPDFNTTDGAVNSYTTTITADDRDREITLAVTASVMGGETPVPVVKTYLLKSKREVDGIAETIYEYTYDDNRSLIRVDKTGTFVLGTEFTTYRYSDDYKIMKGYNESGTVESIRVFEDKNKEKNKFAATIINSRLSVGEYVNYLREISDTASFNNNRHLTKYIYGLDMGQTKAELYVYNSDDTLSRELTGSYSINSNAITALSDTQLHTLNAPSGSFPSADSRLNAVQLNSLNSGTMPFEVSQETTYLYSSASLTGRKYFAYSNAEEESLDVTVSYYANNVIRKIESEGISIEYNTDSLLKKVNNYDYVYTVNGTSVTVTVTNAGQPVATYNFEEE